MEDSNNTGKIVVALLVGVAIGGVLGVLFAPDKGSVTRKKLLSRGEDLKDAVSEKLSGMMDHTEEKAEEIQKKVEGKHA
ncbi:MAG: YtxH domain-containing protein [Bacteroidota bacterium]